MWSTDGTFSPEMNESESAKAKEKWNPDIRRIVPIFYFLFFYFFSCSLLFCCCGWRLGSEGEGQQSERVIKYESAAVVTVDRGAAGL